VKAINQEEERHGLRIAPLIDIIFLLLIFFLVTTTFYQVEKDITVALAEASEGALRDETPTVLIVNVRKDGVIVLDQKQTTLAQLEQRVRTAANRDPRLVVVVRCDREARHEHFVRVLNLCEKIGVSRVAVATFDTSP
jgi:biopolymer transport protein ExbD